MDVVGSELELEEKEAVELFQVLRNEYKREFIEKRMLEELLQNIRKTGRKGTDIGLI